jgi:hypothetical protein
MVCCPACPIRRAARGLAEVAHDRYVHSVDGATYGDLQDVLGLSSVDSSADQTVRALIAAAGLRPDAEELAELVRVYPTFRAALDQLYDVPDARYAPPALVFVASGTYRDWREQDPSSAVSGPAGEHAGA